MSSSSKVSHHRQEVSGTGTYVSRKMKVGLTGYFWNRVSSARPVAASSGPRCVTWHPLAGCQIRSYATWSKSRGWSGQRQSQFTNYERVKV